MNYCKLYANTPEVIEIKGTRREVTIDIIRKARELWWKNHTIVTGPDSRLLVDDNGFPLAEWGVNRSGQLGQKA